MMAVYYFDTRDNDRFIEDSEGLEFDDFEDVKKQAALSLAELARDVTPGTLERKLAVEVKDDWRRPVLRVVLTFEVLLLVE